MSTLSRDIQYEIDACHKGRSQKESSQILDGSALRELESQGSYMLLEPALLSRDMLLEDDPYEVAQHQEDVAYRHAYYEEGIRQEES